MAIYPKAEQRPWKPYDPERFITPRLVILHTNAVNAEDPGPTGGLSWHFQIGEHGDIYQHRDTGTRAAANYQANEFAISIETWDGGDPEGNRWTDGQVRSIVELVTWCHAQHPIPLERPTTWDGAGVGYHRQFPEWNQPVHSCPGNTRAAQFDNEIWPLIVQGGDDLPYTPDQIKQMITDVLHSDGVAGAADPTFNGNAAVLKALAGVTVDPGKVAQALAPLLTASAEHLSATDLAAIAKAVADEQARRQAN